MQLNKSHSRSGATKAPGKGAKKRMTKKERARRSRTIVSRARGKERVKALERGARAAAARLGPAGAELFFHVLVLTLWILIHKVETRRGRGKALQEDLTKVPGVPGRREQDLQCRLLLFGLAEEGWLPTADRIHYRRNPAVLYTVTEAMLRSLVAKYRSLRELQRRFGPRKNRTPEERILEELSRLKRLLEDYPESEMPEDVRAQWEEVQALMSQLDGHHNGKLRSSRPGSSAALPAKPKADIADNGAATT